MDLWRISRFHTLDGTGGVKASGRWHTKGSLIVYLSESPACALLEHLANFEFDVDNLPASFTLLRVHVAQKLASHTIVEAELSPNRRSHQASTRALGDRWLDRGREALLICPSALVPRTLNMALNPRHHDATKAQVVEIIEPPLDPRLLRAAIMHKP